MAKKTFQALAIVLTVSVVALVSFTAGASGSSAGGDSAENGVSFLTNLHSLGLSLHPSGGGHGHHGGGKFWHRMDELVNQLDLSQEQNQHLEAIHRAFESDGGMAHGSMAELHDQLIQQFEQGTIETHAVREKIDQHLAEIRTVAYSITDHFVALLNSLDSEQREIVLAHVQGDHGSHSSPGH